MKHLKRCYGCMKPKREQGVCPLCGFDTEKYHPDTRCMPLGSWLYNRYIVGKVLGEGGFGITYIGWDTILDLCVAIKEYFPAGLAGRNYSETNHSHTLHIYEGKAKQSFHNGLNRCISEAKTLARFHDAKGIVSIRDFFYDNETAYIIMEYIDGITIKEYIKHEGRMEVKQVFGLIQPVMRTLELIHREGMIHRDISPDNIMLTREGSVKLIDFGATRVVNEDSGKSITIMLKRGFAPIEQYMNSSEQGAYTDIYGLSATMYYMLTGRIPQESTSRIVNDKLQSFEELGVNVPKHQEDAIFRGLQVEAKERYLSVMVLYEAIYREDFEQYVEQDKSEDFFALPVLDRVIHEYTQKTNAKYYSVESLRIDSQGEESWWQQKPAKKKWVWFVEHLKKKQNRKYILFGGGFVVLCILTGILWVNIRNNQAISTQQDNTNVSYNKENVLSGSETPNTTPSPTMTEENKTSYVMIDVRGKTVKQAKSELMSHEDTSLQIITKNKYSDDVKKGRIIKQSIGAGKTYEEGEYTHIILTVSKGVERVSVPSVIGLGIASAKRKLRNKKLQVDVVKQYNRSVQKNHVISQSVDAGKKVKVNREVTLYVSLGAKPVAAPKATAKPRVTKKPQKTPPIDPLG